MIVQLGGRSREEARALLERAAQALGAPRHVHAIEDAAPRAFVLSPRILRLERSRTREKVRGTRALREALQEGLTQMRSRALRVLGIREADRRQIAAEIARLPLDAGALASAFAPTLGHMYLAGRESARGELGLPVREAGEPLQLRIDTGFDVVPQNAIDALYADAFAFSRKVVDREKAALTALIAQAMEEGDGVREISARLHDFFDEGIHLVSGEGDDAEISRVVPEDTWIEQVARTEVSRAHMAGIIGVYHEAGIQRIRWLAVEDERTCPRCFFLDGKTAVLGEPFEGGDETEPPSHVACRCNCVAADDEEGA